jgi:hypothetical protein
MLRLLSKLDLLPFHRLTTSILGAIAKGKADVS